jgi:hypothetical protein
MKDAIAYRVVVTATIRRTEKTGGEWKPISESAGKTEYGHTPVIEREVQRDIEVFDMRVEDIDMRRLAAVLHGLPLPEPQA